VSYRVALGRLPKRATESPKQNADGMHTQQGLSEEDLEEDKEDVDETSTEKADAPTLPLTGLDLASARARAVLNANIGACHVKLDEHKDAVTACSEALKDDPIYVKALQRRAISNEKIGSWSSLASAQEDYTTLLKILPPDSPQIGTTKRALQAVKPRVEAAQKKETGEMLDKLKGLGNSILGNFGMSTDNFKFEPNGQGGYSMNFAQ